MGSFAEQVEAEEELAQSDRGVHPKDRDEEQHLQHPVDDRAVDDHLVFGMNGSLKYQVFSYNPYFIFI